MSSAFDVLYQSRALPSLMAQMGVSASYWPQGKVERGVSVTVALVDDPDEQVNDRGEERNRLKTLSVATAEAPDPSDHDRFKVGDDVWAVYRVIDVSGGLATLRVGRLEVVSRSNEQYRSRRGLV